MNAPAFSSWRRPIQSLRRRLSPRGLILLYHRIGEVGVDPWELAVTPQHFDEHLAFIRAQRRAVHFRDLAKATRDGRVPPDALVVAFDDGYADNLLNAKPLLEKHDVPATVFVTTGGLDSTDEFWWDELERIVLSPGGLPERLDLTVGGQPRTWHLGDGANPSSPESARPWKAWQKDFPSARHRLFRELWQLLQPMSEAERNRVRAQLLAWAPAIPPPRPTRRVMSRAEVGRLAEGGLVDVGCHTVSHPQLSQLSRESQEDEIVHSRDDLQAVLGRAVTSFAYPYGDYSAETIRIVRDAGFTAAGTTARGAVQRGTDPFQLPRLHVRDMNCDTFARAVREALEQG